MARAESEESPTTRRISPARVFLNAHHRNTASAAPIRNSTLTFNAACTWLEFDHQPKGIAGRSGADGWMNGLPKKKARPDPNSISAMPMAMSLTLGNLQIQPWNRPNSAPVAEA